jgi:hypothetical protein
MRRQAGVNRELILGLMSHTLRRIAHRPVSFVHPDSASEQKDRSRIFPFSVFNFVGLCVSTGAGEDLGGRAHR